MPAIVLMPEAAVDENNFPARNENEIGSSWKGSGVAARGRFLNSRVLSAGPRYKSYWELRRTCRSEFHRLVMSLSALS